MVARTHYFLQQALRSMRHAPWVQLVAVSTIGISLLVLSSMLLVLRNIDALSSAWGQQVRLVVFVRAGELDPTRDALKQSLAELPEVESVAVRDREVAFAEFKAALGNDDVLVDGIDASLLPSAIELTLRPEHRNPAALSSLAERVATLQGASAIEEVAYGQDLLEKLSKLRDGLRDLSLIIATLVILAVIFIVSNTVRLAMFARREEIEIMHLVGATEGFIRAPFYIEGAIQGAMGAAVATTLLFTLWRTLCPEGESVLRFELGYLPFEFLPTPIISALVLGTSLVGIIASHFAVGRFLRGSPSS